MKAGYTPGPWKIAGHGNGAGILEIHAPSQRAVCGVMQGSLADARLIAAAPELLEACERARIFCAHGHTPEEYADCERVLTAAIQKAQG